MLSVGAPPILYLSFQQRSARKRANLIDRAFLHWYMRRTSYAYEAVLYACSRMAWHSEPFGSGHCLPSIRPFTLENICHWRSKLNCPALIASPSWNQRRLQPERCTCQDLHQFWVLPRPKTHHQLASQSRGASQRRPAFSPIWFAVTLATPSQILFFFCLPSSSLLIRADRLTLWGSGKRPMPFTVSHTKPPTKNNN